MIRVVGALVVALVTMGAACVGGGSDIEDAADRLDDIHSGELELRFTTADPTNRKASTSGFAIEGPFSLPEEDGELAVADVDVTTITGSQESTVGLVSTGEAAYVEVDGRAYELPDDRTAELRLAEGSGAGGAFRELDLADWVVDPATDDGAPLDGAATRRISGKVDVVAMLDDLIVLGRNLGTAGLDEVPGLDGGAGDELESAVRSSSIELLVGQDDGLLRRLEAEVELGLDEQLAALPQLEGLSAASLRFEIDVRDVNEPVTVTPPANPRPYAELAGG